MNKKILVVYYSQSGQLEEILKEFSLPLAEAGHSVEFQRVFPVSPYPFPWKGNTFFAVMPDCVLGIPTALEPFNLQNEKYDLIILGYQAWFLSPSIPSNSILNHASIKGILKDTPVITITGARNMWISAMERVKKNLKETGADLVGNIALVDKHANFVSFITIFYWMLTGKKDRFLNVFPRPGVAEQDIRSSRIYGKLVAERLANNSWQGLQEELVRNNGVVVKYRLMFIESKARKIFGLWANFIIKRKNKAFWLQVFKYYLMIALFIAAPIILTVDAIFFRPFLSKRIRKQKLHYSGVN